MWWVSGKSLPSSNQRWVLGGQSSSFIKMNTLSQLISDGHMWLAYPKSRLLTSTYRNVARCHQADISHGPVYNPIGRFWAQIPQFFPWTYISFSPFSSTLRMGIQWILMASLGIDIIIKKCVLQVRRNIHSFIRDKIRMYVDIVHQVSLLSAVLAVLYQWSFISQCHCFNNKIHSLSASFERFC